MNAPSPTPHIDYGDRAGVLAEIGRLGWALRIHSPSRGRPVAARYRD
jgi:hypothetical protein